jgi:hypothetical protein
MAKSLDTDSLISQAEAAQLRGVSRASINQLIKRGRLQTVGIAGKKLLQRSEVLTFVPQKGGRPGKRPQRRVAKPVARKKKKDRQA